MGSGTLKALWTSTVQERLMVIFAIIAIVAIVEFLVVWVVQTRRNRAS